MLAANANTLPGMQNRSAPHIMRGDYRIVSKSDSDRVMQIQNEFEGAVRMREADFKAEYDAWRMYFAVDGGQWPEEDLRVLREEQRHAYQFDIAGPKVDTLAGSIVGDMPDLDWQPARGQKTESTEAIKSKYYEDKEVANWESHLVDGVRDGLVHGGWFQMIETKKHDPLGNIGIERCLPGYVIPDPYWKTNNDRDLMNLYKVGYFTPEGLAYKYNARHDEIMRAIQDQKRYGKQYNVSNAADQRLRYIGQVGDEWRVIEHWWLEIKKRTMLAGLKTGSAQVVYFPLTDDRAIIERFAQVNQVDWETVEEIPHDEIICHRTAVCPDLSSDLVLADGRSNMQVQGLPFFHFTVTRHNGRNKGIVSAIMDLQRTINRRESLVTELIEKANGGAELYNENLFTDPAEKQRFIKNKNKPGSSFFVDLDHSGKTHEKIGPAQYPPTALDQISRMYDILPLISRVSDAMSAMSDSEDSGILFERKYQINKIGNILLYKSVKQIFNNVGEAYFYAYQRKYRNVPLEVKHHATGQPIQLNARRIDPQTGNIVIVNAVEYTPRCTVIVSENTKSQTYQMRYRSIYAELLEKIAPDSVYYPLYLSKFLSTIDSQSDKDRALVEMANQLEMSRAQMRIITEMTTMAATMKNNALTAAQAEAQLAQMMQMAQQYGNNVAPPDVVNQSDVPVMPDSIPGMGGGEGLSFEGSGLSDGEATLDTGELGV